VTITATNGGTLAITNVALMVGAAAQNAEPEFKKYSDNLIDCRRYYQTGTVGWYGYGAGGANGLVGNLPVVTRAAPTYTLSGATYSNASGAAMTTWTNSQSYRAVAAVTATGAMSFYFDWTADADF
jgi:hypothetical protein